MSTALSGKAALSGSKIKNKRTALSGKIALSRITA
jgi:hypothetical protein